VGPPALLPSMPEADRHWLSMAVEISRQSSPTPTNYAVGAVVVDHDGTLLETGYTGEIESRDHAEEVALSKLVGQPELGVSTARPGRPVSVGFTQATMYCTLEPCLTRRSRPMGCAALIAASGIKRVVIALREPPIFAAGRGIEALRSDGIEVVVIDDLGHQVWEINSHVFGLGQTDRPSVPESRSKRYPVVRLPAGLDEGSTGEGQDPPLSS
jgi:diaminohydroxyphosphoribosylaminopyrimidine deaminase / 5-amino-6-(5-phosphoribosylamino)uracil reductase